MIARESLDLFDAVLAHLAELAPPGALGHAATPAAHEDGFLHPSILPQAGVAIVAVIDHAIPFAHRLLTHAGHSRVAAIWLMDAPMRARRPDIPFGQELRGLGIDALLPLGDEGAHRAAGIGAPRPAAGHGAAVATLAAGFAPDDRRGRAHPVIGVSLPDVALAETSGSLGALFLQAAVIFVIARARGLAREMARAAGRALRPPVVVNLSLGVSAGAGSVIERLQDAIAGAAIDDLGPVEFVLPTGNSRQARLNAVLAPGDEIGWCLPPDDATPSAVEITAPDAAPLNLRVTLPDGRSAATRFGPQGGAARLCTADGHEIARAILQQRAPQGSLSPAGAGRRACLTLIAAPTIAAAGGAPPGRWLLRPEGGAACTLSVQRDDRLPGLRLPGGCVPGLGRGRQSRLDTPGFAARDDSGRWPGADPAPLPDPAPLIRRNGTANSYAGGRLQIRVGASLAQPRGAPAPYSSLLPDGQNGDVSAAADASAARRGMVVPGSHGATRARLSGSSLAAPQLTRWLAGQMAQGARFADRAALRAALAGPPGEAPDLPPPDLPWRTGLE